MKKSLLKASLFCLGAILLCGLYSFKSLQIESFQQNYQTEAIFNDTLITPEGEEPQLIKESIVEDDQRQCSCYLFVSENTTTESWRLGIKSSCSCTLIATYVYTVYYIDEYSGEFKERTEGPEEIEIGNVEIPQLDHGTIGKSVCFPVSIDARFKEDPDGNN